VKAQDSRGWPARTPSIERPLTNAVASGEPFHSTVEPGTKLVPLTVRVNAAAPAVAVLGLRLVMVGTGAETVNGRESERPVALESATQAEAKPAAPNALAGIAASMLSS